MGEGGMVQTMRRQQVIAVLRAPSADGAIRASEALIAGGVTLIEVTTTTRDWTEALRGVAALAGAVAGVGTLLTAEQVHQAAEAGATFAVSPGFSAGVADACAERNLPYFPGIATPTELMEALAHPATTALKLFPAEIVGGVKCMKALKGPFPDAEFVPTGGIHQGNAAAYLEAGALAVGLSSICKANRIEEEAWAGITEGAAQLLQAIG